MTGVCCSAVPAAPSRRSRECAPECPRYDLVVFFCLRRCLEDWLTADGLLPSSEGLTPKRRYSEIYTEEEEEDEEDTVFEVLRAARVMARWQRVRLTCLEASRTSFCTAVKLLLSSFEIDDHASRLQLMCEEQEEKVAALDAALDLADAGSLDPKP